MRIPLQISLQGAPDSEALVVRILKQAAKLETLHPRITDCRVTISDFITHEGAGCFEVRVEVRMPSDPSVMITESHADVYIAVRKAFDALRRQLEERPRKAARKRQKPKDG